MEYFGHALTHKFIPDEDGVSFSLTSQNPSIFIFNNRPNRADAALGTSAIQAITSWTQQASVPYTCTYTVPALDDPDQQADNLDYQYWESINFRIDSGAQIQTFIRDFWLRRAEGTESYPDTTITDVKKSFPAITSYVTDVQLSEFLATAISLLRSDLEKEGVDWARIRKLSKANIALAYKVIEIVSLSQRTRQGDRHDLRIEDFRHRYENQISKIDFPADSQGTGEAESSVSIARDMVVTRI